MEEMWDAEYLGPQKISQKEEIILNLAEFFAKSQTPRLSGGVNEPQNEPLNSPPPAIRVLKQHLPIHW